MSYRISLILAHLTRRHNEVGFSEKKVKRLLLSSSTFHMFVLFRTTGPISTTLSTDYPWGKGNDFS